MFDKIFIIKPLTSNILNGERYIVCKCFNMRYLEENYIKLEKNIENILLSNIKINIHSLISNEIPYFFLNKIEESNAMIGQQQLETYSQLINLYNNKNKEDKINILKRNNIQKCIQWCIKKQIPYNNFTDKVNIFLTPKK